jgi:acyl-ACP thioesterase
MKKYRKTFEIPYYESDKNGRLRQVSLLEYLGETSGAHTDYLGFNSKKLQELNCAWMLNRWKVKIHKYPKVKEKISIETWTSKMDRFYANREFIIYDEEDNEIGRASTVWIFIDMNKKKPVRIPAELLEIAKPVEETTFDDFYDFKKEIEIEENIDFHVRRSDIDYNNHVNNTKYLSWILETVPDNIYENYRLSEFELLYKKETVYGNTILAGINILDEEVHEKGFIHKIRDSNTGEVHALGMTKWIDIK